MNNVINCAKNQMLASLTTLRQCIETCPDSAWNEIHGDAPFSQAVFHTLFCMDFYLSPDEANFKNQPFHTRHTAMFKDYEELEYKKPVQVYTLDEIKTYLEFCRQKIMSLDVDDALKISTHKNFSFLELYIYITRHTQHHAAQLGLRIQQIIGKELKWFSSGY
jgi:hypothetical protein